MKGILQFICMVAFICLIGSIVGAVPAPFVANIFWGSLVVMFAAAALSDK